MTFLGNVVAGLEELRKAGADNNYMHADEDMFYVMFGPDEKVSASGEYVLRLNNWEYDEDIPAWFIIV